VVRPRVNGQKVPVEIHIRRVLLDDQHVEGPGERVGCLLVLVALGAHVVELATQFCVLLAECGLIAGMASWALTRAQKRSFRSVCSRVRTCRLMPASAARHTAIGVRSRLGAASGH
jgi:hypothetical protein